MRAEKNERVLVTTLTKRMSEDLAEYYTEVGVRCRYLHSEIETLERIKILRGLRKGEFDVLIGINLLREGLDLPEVSLVAILDADKEGFLRSGDALIQTMGRAARHLNGRAILYADKMTDSMKRAIGETDRRREIQVRYNVENNITPESIIKPIDMTLVAIAEADYEGKGKGGVPKFFDWERAPKGGERGARRAKFSWARGISAHALLAKKTGQKGRVSGKIVRLKQKG